MRAVHMRTEYLFNPIGIDIPNPRFYWQCEGGVVQRAYQIMCFVKEDMLWDSDKVLSASMTHIAYEGIRLTSKMPVKWKVRLWDEEDVPGEWTEAFFEMGLLEMADWKGKWITGNFNPQKTKRYPVDYFRKQFHVKGKISQARLYITACGIYQATLNGKRIGEDRMTPGSTDYRVKIQYQTYDITKIFKAEKKQIFEIQLADGWYRGALGGWGITHVYGNQTKVRCQIEINYVDGTTATIGSDSSFDWCNDGPLQFADLQDGEIYDATRSPSYSKKARECQHSNEVKLVASNNVTPKEQEFFIPELLYTPTGKTVLDFKQNLAGFIKFEIKGKKGQQVHLTMGETLDADGELTQKNFQIPRIKGYLNTWKKIKTLVVGEKLKKSATVTPKQEITFICSGNKDSYKTEFAVFGFRYVQVDGDVEIVPEKFQAIAVYSNMEQVGEFNCSHSKINQLYRNTLWSMKGNFLDVPTDCPTRERMGWTGDAQLFFETGAYMMDVASFYRKYIADMRDAQKKTGSVPAILPYSGLSMAYDSTGGSVGWADALVLIPYRFWKHYGDTEILQEFYSMMRKYAMYMIKRSGAKNKKSAGNNPYHKYVYQKGFHFGEWLEPEDLQKDSQEEEGNPLMAAKTEEATAYLHYTMKCMSEIAHKLGEKEDEALFMEYAKGAAQAYNFLFLQSVPNTERQAKYVRPLAFGIADKKQKEALANRLFQAVEKREYRIGTGFLSTPFILPTLVENGRLDLAYKMLENEQAPGWLNEVNRGATTIWEDWEGKSSNNHYSPGSVCMWLFDTVAGIKIIGENFFEISPMPGGTLKFAKASYQSIYGMVESSWEIDGNRISLTVHVPVNTKAKIAFMGKIEEVNAGEYTLRFHMR